MKTIAKFHVMGMSSVEFKFDPSNPKEVVSVFGNETRKIPTKSVLEWIRTYKHIDNMPRSEYGTDKVHYAVDDDGGYQYTFFIGSYWSKLFFNRQQIPALKGQRKMGSISIQPIFPDLYSYKDWLKSIESQLRMREEIEDGHDGIDIQEKIDVDARTGIFRRTLTRLEQARARREGKTDKYMGMYDDGTGKGVVMPKPITFNKESRRFTVEIDGRTKGLREAMKRVEMYRKLREEKKKKTLMSSWKESVEETESVILEGASLTKGQIMDAVGMQGGKFEVSEEELSPKQKAYRAFFAKALKKFGKDSPASMDDGEKKKFFDYLKANWKG